MEFSLSALNSCEPAAAPKLQFLRSSCSSVVLVSSPLNMDTRGEGNQLPLRSRCWSAVLTLMSDASCLISSGASCGSSAMPIAQLRLRLRRRITELEVSADSNTFKLLMSRALLLKSRLFNQPSP